MVADYSSSHQGWLDCTETICYLINLSHKSPVWNTTNEQTIWNSITVPNFHVIKRSDWVIFTSLLFARNQKFSFSSPSQYWNTKLTVSRAFQKQARGPHFHLPLTLGTWKLIISLDWNLHLSTRFLKLAWPYCRTALMMTSTFTVSSWKAPNLSNWLGNLHLLTADVMFKFSFRGWVLIPLELWARNFWLEWKICAWFDAILCWMLAKISQRNLTITVWLRIKVQHFAWEQRRGVRVAYKGINCYQRKKLRDWIEKANRLVKKTPARKFFTSVSNQDSSFVFHLSFPPGHDGDYSSTFALGSWCYHKIVLPA